MPGPVCISVNNASTSPITVPSAWLHWQPTDSTFPVPNIGTAGSSGDLTVKGSDTTISATGIVIPNTSQSWIRTASDGTLTEWSSPNAFTIALWLNRSGNPSGAYGNMISKASRQASWSSPFTQIQLVVQSNTSIAYRAAAATPLYSTAYGSQPVVGAWTHVASVYDGTNLLLYLNAVLVASTAPAGSWANNWSSHGPWFIGSNSAISGSLAESCPGTYQDIRVFDSALSATQILELRNTFI